MAAVDNRNRNLDGFVGLNWSCWIDKASDLLSEVVLNHQDLNEHEKTCFEAMTLHKEDMHIFGQCPAHDDFYLVVCSHCGQLVKPQAFEQHCERRHGPFQSATSAPQRPRPGRNVSSSREKSRSDRYSEVKPEPLSAPCPVQHKHSGAQKQPVSLPQVDQIPQEGADATPWSTGPALSASSTKSLRTNPETRSPSVKERRSSTSPLLGTQANRRMNLNEDSRTDFNTKQIHCSIFQSSPSLFPTGKEPCLVLDQDTMLETKKTPSSGSNDSKQPREESTGSSGQNVEVCSTHPRDRVKHSERSEERATAWGKKITFASSCLKIRSEFSVEAEQNNSVKVEIRPPYPFNQNLLSDEESEAEEPEDTSGVSASSWHPKPLGLCTFGCRTLGCSIFTFDRRLHHLRFALSAMLEAHASTHLWKKNPKVPSNLRSHHVNSTAVQTCARGPGPSLDSVSVGQNAKPLVSDNLRNFKSAGRTKASRKAAKFSHTSGDKVQRFTIDLEKQRSLCGRINGTFSQQPPDKHSAVESKSGSLFSNQLPQLKDRPQGAQQRGLAYDHRTIGQKCKGRSEVTVNKFQRLTSPHRWRKDQTQ